MGASKRITKKKLAEGKTRYLALPEAAKRNILQALQRYSVMPWEWICNGALMATPQDWETLSGPHGAVAFGLLGLAKAVAVEGSDDQQSREFWTRLLNACQFIVAPSKFSKDDLVGFGLTQYDIPVDIDSLDDRAGGMPGSRTTPRTGVRKGGT